MNARGRCHDAYLAAGFWQLQPNVENALTKTLFVLMVVSRTLLFAGIVTKLSVLYGSTLQQALPVTSLAQNIARGVVITTGLLIALNGLGLSITPMLTALGVGGLAVALALQDTLANLFAGVYVTLAGQIRVGGYVRLDSGEEGYVADIGWRSTRIRMLPNNLVLVPNAKLSQAIVTNYCLPRSGTGGARRGRRGLRQRSDARRTAHVRRRERNAPACHGRCPRV